MDNTIVMFCYARSGGTMINQCLGSLPDVIIMSEVNPIEGGGTGPNALRKISDQAKKWYGIEINSNIFEENVFELDNYCKRNNKKLVIRDWSFVNFVPIRYNQFNPPNRLLTFDILKKGTVKTFAIVRDAVDVWISLKSSPKKNYDQNLEHLFKYVSEIINKDIKIFKYEDFCDNPDKIMAEICEYTGLKFDNSYKKYASFTTLNGDIDLASYSRGIQQGKIARLPRKLITEAEIYELETNTRMKQINQMLDYPTHY